MHVSSCHILICCYLPPIVPSFLFILRSHGFSVDITMYCHELLLLNLLFVFTLRQLTGILR